MEHDAGHGAEVAGMPQLDLSTFPNQIFWLVVTLIVMYLILSKVALPRIGSVLADRKGQITNDIAAAEELKEQAAEAEANYEKALADARAEAQRIAAETRAEIQKDIDIAMEKAEVEISARTAESEKRISEIRASAEDGVTTVAQDTAKAIVSALGGSATAAMVTKAVDARLKGGS